MREKAICRICDKIISECDYYTHMDFHDARGDIPY